MRRLETILPFNYFHYYAFSVLIGLLAYESVWFLFVYLPFYFLIRDYKKWMSVVFLGMMSFLFLHIYQEPSYPKNTHFTITEKKAYDNYYAYEASSGFNRYLFYYNEDLKIGDNIHISYSYESFEEEKMPNGFNYKNYYASKRIFYKLSVHSLEVVGHSFKIQSIKYRLMNLFQSYPKETKHMIYSLIFAHNTFSEEFKENASLLGISHLFAISGLHINLMIQVLNKVLIKFKSKDKIILVMLFLYVVILGFPISLLRAFLMVFFLFIFKKKGLTKLDALSISFLCLLIINPFYRYRLAFILSFLVSFFLIVLKLGKKFKGTIKGNIVAYFTSFLLVSNINGGFVPSALLFSIVYTLLFPILIMPLVFLSLLPGVYFISEPIFSGFSYSLKGLLPLYKIKMPYVKIGGIIIYLSFFIALLLSTNLKTRIKRGFILGIFLIFLFIRPYINPQGYVYFLNVGQGDSTWIQRPFNQCNILIDAHRGTHDFIRTLGDVSIDYFFITHGDLDHASEASEIINTYPVLNAFTNAYDDSDVLVNLPLERTKKGDVFLCGDVFIEVLSPKKDYQNRNDNSLVLKITFDEYVYLFTGDITATVEQDLIDFYGTHLQSDYLHVSHHGSNTSTTKAFLYYVNPKTAIISVGKNAYNHPHEEVIQNLKNNQIEIRQTLYENTIIIYKYRIRRKYDLLYK